MIINRCALSTILFILFTLSTNVLFAQENLVEGFIVDKQNTMVKGVLDLQESNNSPKQIRFKAKSHNKFNTYGPNDIKSVGTIDSSIIFVSAKVEIEVSPSITNQLTEISNFQLEEKYVFLQRLVEGKKNLYQYRNYSKPNFYFYSNNKYNLLLFKKYLDYSNGKQKVTAKKNYLGQLIFYFGDISGINNKIKHVEYNQDDLMSVYEYYYKTSKQSMTYKFQESDNKLFTKKLYLGITYSSINFNSDSEIFNYLTKVDFQSSLDLTLGFGLNYQLKDKFKNLSNVNEIFLNHFKFQNSYYEETNPEIYSTTNTELNFTYLKLNNLLLYHFPNEIANCRVFISTGISTSVILFSNNSKEVQSRFYSTERMRSDIAIQDPRKIENGFILGTGAEYQNFSVEVRHEITNGMSYIASLSSTVNRTFFLLSYHFK